jgi:hypothetical protein
MKVQFFLLLSLLSLLSGSAMAQSNVRVDGISLPVYTVSPNASANANATSTSQGVGSQGQSLTVDSHAVYQAQQRNPVSTAVAPTLTSSNDTCMGSSSFGAQAVAFGLSFGRSYTDDNCLMLKNARELWNMGYRGAALARLCMDEHNRSALEASGVNCPVRRAQRTADSRLWDSRD